MLKTAEGVHILNMHSVHGKEECHFYVTMSHRVHGKAVSRTELCLLLYCLNSNRISCIPSPSHYLSPCTLQDCTVHIIFALCIRTNLIKCVNVPSVASSNELSRASNAMTVTLGSWMMPQTGAYSTGATRILRLFASFLGCGNVAHRTASHSGGHRAESVRERLRLLHSNIPVRSPQSECSSAGDVRIVAFNRRPRIACESAVCGVRVCLPVWVGNTVFGTISPETEQ